jgi:DNA-directed RNA polymerase specialized sigma24 family protein
VDEEHSITQLIQNLHVGDSQAARQLWEHFLGRLIREARHRLRGTPRRALDEEDVALSAFDAFLKGVADGRFAQLDNRDDLWQVLLMLTDRKAIAAMRKEMADKRGGGRTRGESVFDQDSSSLAIGLDQAAASLVFMDDFTLEVRELLLQLRDEQLRQIALARLAGYTSKEIAAQQRIPLRAVERKLQLIRRKREPEIQP